MTKLTVNDTEILENSLTSLQFTPNNLGKASIAMYCKQNNVRYSYLSDAFAIFSQIKNDEVEKVLELSKLNQSDDLRLTETVLEKDVVFSHNGQLFLRNKLYSCYIKAWYLELDELLEEAIKLGFKNVESDGHKAIWFSKLTAAEVMYLHDELCNEKKNGSNIWYDGEEDIVREENDMNTNKGTTFNFTKRVGMISKDLMPKLEAVLNSFKKNGQITNFELSSYKLVVNENGNSLEISANATKERPAELSFVQSTLLLIFKAFYNDSFEINAESIETREMFRAIKYSNKVLNSKLRIKNNALIVK